MRFTSRHVAIALLVIGASACGSSSDSSAPAARSVAPAESTVDDPESSADPGPTTVAGTEDGGEGGGDAPSPSDGAPTIAVPEALQFTAPLVGGGEFSGADLADKPTVFWFWAPT